MVDFLHELLCFGRGGGERIWTNCWAKYMETKMIINRLERSYYTIENMRIQNTVHLKRMIYIHEQTQRPLQLKKKKKSDKLSQRTAQTSPSYLRFLRYSK